MTIDHIQSDRSRSSLHPGPARYFISERLVFEIVRQLTREYSGSVSHITRDDIRRFISDRTCPICGRVFLRRVDVATHHAIEIFDGIEVIARSENVIPDSVFIHPPAADR